MADGFFTRARRKNFYDFLDFNNYFFEHFNAFRSFFVIYQNVF